MAVTLGLVLIALCFLSAWIKLQVRLSSPLCCTDLTAGCIFQMTGELSRVPLLLLLPTATSRSRPPCSDPETPWPCSWLVWWSPQSSTGWLRQSSPILITVLESPGPSNVVRIEIAVLFPYIYNDNIETILPHQKVFPPCTFSSVRRTISQSIPLPSPSHGRRIKESIIEQMGLREKCFWVMF